MKKIFGLMMALAIVIGLSMPANATLILRGTDTLGNRLIYDDDLNITWYDFTKAEDTWQNQVNWADALPVTFGSTVYSDWRLPSTVDGPDSYGYYITNSEMGHLYYAELGNIGFCDIDGDNCPQAGWGLTNTGDFQNLQGYYYWSGTEYSADPVDAWDFNFTNGYQQANGKGVTFLALAVRSGDVSTSVPEPATMFLLGSGLAGMAVLRKRLGRREG